MPDEAVLVVGEGLDGEAALAELVAGREEHAVVVEGERAARVAVGGGALKVQVVVPGGAYGKGCDKRYWHVRKWL